ncbi:AAA family ATPase [Fictibacillus nanhaiensis]|uniref:AAA family ATPase n=1 Tax=Fictibacillus nanhaiensis TaxID=742169 RepID=UPI002E1C9588|nr:AAA family ATPase [Fictibacillus nanhaiensis]
MTHEDARTVYLLSGPAGVGKSTTAIELVKSMRNSAYLSGDDISHMHINGREKPWESEQEHNLIWNNILQLTKNFIDYGCDVVIDYITFPKDAEWFTDQLRKSDVVIKYVVLWADEKTLVKRDALRDEEERMGERCLALFREFINSGLDSKYLLHTSLLTPKDIHQVVQEITHENRFILI